MSFEIDDDLVNEGAWPTLASPRVPPTGAWIVAFCAGLATAYFFDPDRGRRRRVMFMDQMSRRVRETIVWWEKKQRHLGHVVEGLPYRFGRLWFRSQEVVDDERLVQRVRARIGRVIRHPGSVSVVARDGRVTLSGPIMADEIERVLRCARTVPGVRHVDNAMTPYSRGARVPGLQGEGKPYLNP